MNLDIGLIVILITALVGIVFAGWMIYLIGYSIWYIADTIVKVNRSNS